ncbi:unnamed protein product [Dibothriocephalus latus]|uniref:Uncharacterized protein n=1 Tax=Dibothriocephalus latus TaxID=60516 RepID=A0A3P7LR94_DIBLA|nr:unnamed protein product [Dibothriocephalus latus]
MDFSTAPIADLEVDDLSVGDENWSNHVEDAINCVLKRSMSDPFDIAVGLNLEVSLERLIWTFDNDISANLTSTDANNKVEKEQDAQTKRSNVDAIK